MLKYRSGEEKLYINSLCVSGSSIKLLNPTNKCYINKTIKITFDTANADIRQQKECSIINNIHCKNNLTRECKKVEKTVTRLPLNLNVTDCKNFQVCNKQLKQIYETCEVRDFERILNNLQICDDAESLVTNKVDQILKKINADDIYEEFFGRYYNHLYELIETQRHAR